MATDKRMFVQDSLRNFGFLKVPWILGKSQDYYVVFPSEKAKTHLSKGLSLTSSWLSLNYVNDDGGPPDFL